nr:hypothetical protein Iba_chr04cCG17500 [Ipomoea batatas]
MISRSASGSMKRLCYGSIEACLSVGDDQYVVGSHDVEADRFPSPGSYTEEWERCPGASAEDEFRLISGPDISTLHLRSGCDAREETVCRASIRWHTRASYCYCAQKSSVDGCWQQDIVVLQMTDMASLSSLELGLCALMYDLVDGWIVGVYSHPL